MTHHDPFDHPLEDLADRDEPTTARDAERPRQARAGDAANSICVASYNVRQGLGTDWQRLPERSMQVIAQVPADVFALQEAGAKFSRWLTSASGTEALSELGYSVVHLQGLKHSLAWHGNILLVRASKAELIRSRPIALPALEPRGAALADLQLEGFKLRVVGMHLGLIGLWRKRQAEAVLHHLDALEHQLPTVLMGDLNEWNTRARSLRRFARHHHVAAPGPSFHSKRRIFALDRIITSPDIQIEASGVHDTPLAQLASDHLPVWARLSCPHRAAVGERDAGRRKRHREFAREPG